MKVSAVTFQDIKHVSFQSKIVSNKDLKNNYDADLKLPQLFGIAYNSLLFELLII